MQIKATLIASTNRRLKLRRQITSSKNKTNANCFYIFQLNFRRQIITTSQLQIQRFFCYICERKLECFSITGEFFQELIYLNHMEKNRKYFYLISSQIKVSIISYFISYCSPSDPNKKDIMFVWTLIISAGIYLVSSSRLKT